MNRLIYAAFVSALLVGTMCMVLIAGAFYRPQVVHQMLFSGHFPGRQLMYDMTRKSNVEIVRQASQSVVIVIATRAVRPQQPTPQNDPTATPENNVLRGTGTGFIIDPEGYIVTNEHVIKDADRIRVKLADGSEYRAVIKGVDLGTDLALLKIEADGLSALTLGDSKMVQVGDPVIAIGNPLEYEYSVTAGIVSAKERKIYNDKPYLDFIQTDAAINRGNSGGPLLNQSGEVIAVNTVIRVDGRGISFAVPSNLVKQVVGQLRTHGFVARGFLGLTPANITAEYREGLGLGDVQGVLVTEVSQDKPADRAGIKTYDVITYFDGRRVTRADEFFGYVANTPPMQKVEVIIMRSGQQLKLHATLAPRDEDRPVGLRPAAQKPGLLLGFSVRENTPETLRESRAGQHLPQREDGGDEGVVVSEIDPLGPASDTSLAVGMVIVEANRHPIRKLEDFNKVTSQLSNGSALVLRLKAPPQNDLRLFAIRVGESR
jgi:serine protease Do